MYRAVVSNQIPLHSKNKKKLFQKGEKQRRLHHVKDEYTSRFRARRWETVHDEPRPTTDAQKVKAEDDLQT